MQAHGVGGSFAQLVRVVTVSPLTVRETDVTNPVEARNPYGLTLHVGDDLIALFVRKTYYLQHPV